jgi:FkbM family methyltransferase
MKQSLRSITLNGCTIHVTDDHPEFWDRFAANTWEPETLLVFDHYIDRETLFLDVGCWIGPTLLYAASRAKYAAGFEPDPAAYEMLERNVAANPNLGNIRIQRIAIAACPGILRLGSQGEQGDSMSSALFAGSQKSWTAEARRLDDLAEDWPPANECFVKIDIEGGEYDTLPALASFLHSRRATAFISFHQRFFLQSSAGRGLVPKLLGELRLFLRIVRFLPLLLRYPYIYDEHRNRLSSLGFLRRRHWRRTETLLLSYRPAPWEEKANHFEGMAQ